MDGYYRFPAIQGDRVCFISEDDVWLVSSKGGVAQRLTTDEGRCSSPSISPDLKWVAYASQKEGYLEVYCISTEGGLSRRLTFLGATTRVLGWKSESEILVYSNYQNAFDFSIYALSIDGGEPVRVKVGNANRISYGEQGEVVIGRCIKDTARWKRYRGGTVGNIWFRSSSRSPFRQVLDLESDLADPMIVGQRLYFISDHEGIGRLYSSNFDGGDILCHSAKREFYVRNARTDGGRIVYHAGGELFLFDPMEDKEKKIQIKFTSSKHLVQRKFDYPEDCLHGFDLSPDGSKLAASFRGKIVTAKPWVGPVFQHGKMQGVRYRLPSWLSDKKTLVCSSDELNGEDRIVAFDTEKGTEELLEELDVGIIRGIFPSPKDNKLLLTNHRNELFLVDLVKKSKRLMDRSDHSRIRSISWSPDGKWVVYTYCDSPASSVIRLQSIGNRKKYDLTQAVRYDHSPIFSHDGKFVYFVGERAFLPQYDAQMFDMSFVYSSQIYAISLLSNQKNPFRFEREEKDDEEDEDKKDKKDKKEKLIQIDLEGIQERVCVLPLPVGDYSGLSANSDMLFYYSTTRNLKSGGGDRGKTALWSFDFSKLEKECILSEVSSYALSLNHKKMAYYQDEKLFVVKAGDEAKESAKNKFSPESGEVDLNRIKVEIDRQEEWQQMFRECWLRQREHFWTADMSGVNWQLVFERYYPLLNRLGSRSEFSDLVWEMQGELGTSHCYEFGGDYQEQDFFALGRLGCSFKQSKKTGKYTVDTIWSGDPTNTGESSPLKGMGITVKSGDEIVAINGRKIGNELSPREALLRYSGEEISLSTKAKGSKKLQEFQIKTMSTERSLLYRNWVEKNRSYVHKVSDGKIGYVHIPDMVTRGYAEFHRYYLTECQKDGLIVDVRYNSGGHVSQLILERLSRKRIGYDKIRWSKDPEPYPLYSIAGPIVGLTNEWAGSDGDIFSHSFKMLKLGPLVGKRTWGGVIGITCQYSMVDGGITSQPEYSFWFEDVGWGVENYGTDPDVDVTISPEDYEKGNDPQLNKSIDIALDELKKNPVKKPKLGNRPKLVLPKI